MAALIVATFEQMQHEIAAEAHAVEADPAGVDVRQRSDMLDDRDTIIDGRGLRRRGRHGGGIHVAATVVRDGNDEAFLEETLPHGPACRAA
jgi:hypothetical protein